MREPKLLILGTSDSGKSTLLKQLKLLHGNGFSEEEKTLSKKIIIVNLLQACDIILNNLPRNKDELQEVMTTK
jgi:ABC-type lipoprotein export system ATPase subunit